MSTRLKRKIIFLDFQGSISFTQSCWKWFSAAATSVFVVYFTDLLNKHGRVKHVHQTDVSTRSRFPLHVGLFSLSYCFSENTTSHISKILNVILLVQNPNISIYNYTKWWKPTNLYVLRSWIFEIVFIGLNDQIGGVLLHQSNSECQVVIDINTGSLTNFITFLWVQTPTHEVLHLKQISKYPCPFPFVPSPPPFFPNPSDDRAKK